MNNKSCNTAQNRTLIIACHHNSNSLTVSVAQQIYKKISKNKQEVKLVDLYRENFNPIFTLTDQLAHNQMMELKDVGKYQKMIAESNRLVLVYPLWWGGYPALLKGFIDRVFSHGFAYEATGEHVVGLLTYLTVDIIFMMDNDSTKYEHNKLISSIKNINSRIIFEFCGCNYGKFLFIDNVCFSSNSEIKQKIAVVLSNY